MSDKGPMVGEMVVCLTVNDLFGAFIEGLVVIENDAPVLLDDPNSCLSSLGVRLVVREMVRHPTGSYFAPDGTPGEKIVRVLMIEEN